MQQKLCNHSKENYFFSVIGHPYHHFISHLWETKWRNGIKSIEIAVFVKELYFTQKCKAGYFKHPRVTRLQSNLEFMVIIELIS